VFTAATVGWTFPYTLNTGEDLVLTQSLNGPPTTTTSFNFDTSDILGPGNFPAISITANGVTTVFFDVNQVLNVRGLDPITNTDNEAQDYGPALIGPGYQVFLGYADNTHTGACGAWATSIGLLGSTTCLPSVFSGATYFDGAGGILPPQLVQTQPNHCNALGADCYEGGVIRIVATSTTPVPEPTTAMLLLTGAATVAMRRRRWTRRA
jgi:hypothetical protein